METASRALIALSLLAIGIIVLAITLPDVGGLGPPPPTDDAISTVQGAVTQPLVLIALALSFVLVLASGGSTRSKPMTASVTAKLPPMPDGLSSPQRVRHVVSALHPAVRAASSGEQVLDLLLEGASRAGASDVHVLPSASDGQVSFRVDGNLEPVVSLTQHQFHTLINRLKVVAKLVHYKSDAPQDGQFSQQVDGGSVDVRLSLLPTQHGEKAVLRLTGLRGRVPTLSDLGLAPAELAALTNLLSKPHGLLFFTGPTGSGKTTSIYGALQHLMTTRTGAAQIATIEDPIELTIPNAAQTQVNRATGLDFAFGLRAALRQDPNIIVVGEIRDAETAGIAVQAGLTGHLILTTVHADSAAGVFNRLMEMGVEPSILASVSIASISQRLVRRLCSCKRQQAPTAEQVARLQAAKAELTTAFVPVGCDRCGGTGFDGRTAVFEVLHMSPAIRDALGTTPSTQALMAIARAEGTVPLFDVLLAKVKDGVTTLDEALRVAG